MARKASMNEALLSIADISRHFSLPESTTRYYCKRFAAFIPSVGEGRRRRYRQETLDVIAAILEQMQKSRTAAAVEDVLQARFPAMRLLFPMRKLRRSIWPAFAGFFSDCRIATAGAANLGSGRPFRSHAHGCGAAAP